MVRSEQVFVIFDEEVALRLDELIRFESVEAEAGVLKGRPYQVIPDGVKTRVYTQSTGFFYTAMTVAEVQERIQVAWAEAEA